MKTFITIKDGLIDEIVQTDESPGNEWTEVPDSFSGSHGEKAEWFDDNWLRIPDVVLVTQGKRIDDRGTWYNKETRKEEIVRDFDVEIDKTLYTKEKPIENEAYQRWDEHENNWVVDTEKKEIAELQKEIGNLKAEISARDWKVIKAQRLNENLDEIYPGETAWYENAVAEINRLEGQLAQLKIA
jgi:hypothetical protein